LIGITAPDITMVFKRKSKIIVIISIIEVRLGISSCWGGFFFALEGTNAIIIPYVKLMLKSYYSDSVVEATPPSNLEIGVGIVSIPTFVWCRPQRVDTTECIAVDCGESTAHKLSFH
jgi:hypothetical protein